jgi:beta-galactosidase
MMIPKGAIFDQDGLLFDTEVIFEQGWIKAGREFGVPIDSELISDSRTRVKGMRFRKMFATVLAMTAIAAPAENERLLENWRFAKSGPALFGLHPENVDFDDSRWEEVRVPHDWAIYGPFNPAEYGGTGKLPWRGVGWYRHEFTLDAAERGKCVFLDFDGVMASPAVYVNGHLAGGWDYGYMSFRVDATPYVKFGGKNTLAVRASTLDHNSRWYPGAGIYRKVALRVRNRAHFGYNGIFIATPEISKTNATVEVQWETENAPQGAKVSIELVRDGACAARAVLPAAARTARLTVVKPALWDVDSPNLYSAEVTLLSESGGPLDRESVRFGIRSIAFPVASGRLANDWEANGFHLNGRRVQLKGVNLHSDLGLLGMAFNRSAMRRQLLLMKRMGANAVRTSHNCPAPELLDLCDEMGLLVWNECFDKWDGTAGRRAEENLEEYVIKNLQAFVRRDRNHPCVIIWSMSNEIADGPDGLTRERCRLFREKMRECDTTRPVGCGNFYLMARENVLDREIYADLDITGWNYRTCYRPIKARYPEKPIVYSESASAHSTYGFYQNPPPDGKRRLNRASVQVDSYDHNAWPDIADVEFNYMERDRYVCGEFVWTGIDYLGEPSPFMQEARSSYFGIVDLAGIPKDRYYLYRSHWNKKDETVHILPHWNWSGHEGKSVPVYVYTSGDRAELFLNGRSLGFCRKDASASAGLTNLLAGAKAREYPKWLRYDLDTVRTFSTVTIDFERDYAGYSCEMETSLDGEVWTGLFSKQSGENVRPEPVRPVTARYIRVRAADEKGAAAPFKEICVFEPRLDVKSNAHYYEVCGKYRLRWFDVPYEPGEIRAVAYRGDVRIGEAVMKTAAAPAALKLTVEPKPDDDPDALVWVQVDAVDKKGVRNPLAENRVDFNLRGPGKILAVGNGNPHAFEAFTDTDSHPMFFGKVVAVIRRDGPGRLELEVLSPGLDSASVELR